MTQSKRVHFIGVAGIGMSATALLMAQQGWTVTGSDEAFYPPASDVLAAARIAIRSPHDAANIPGDVDRFVIGKHAKLTMANPEVAAAYRHGAPVLSYPDVLHEILAGRTPWVVAGSYGKSTMASILAWTLTHGGVDAGFFIGAIPKGMASAAQLGSHPVFVLEGDEYPSSNEDPRSKFLHYRAHDLVLTSAVHDHLNIFATQADYLKPFTTLVQGLPSHGLMVVCRDEPHAFGLAASAPCRVITYALERQDADYHAANLRYGLETEFDLIVRGQTLGRFTTSLLGAHNMQNLIGAAALLLERKLLSHQAIAKAFAAFAGVKRRMDRVTLRSRVPAYEGFGSSVDKARSAIEAMTLHFPGRRLAVVFEPHTFSWRARESVHWYDTVFAGVDLIAILPPPDHGAQGSDQLSQADIARIVAGNYGSSLRILTPHLADWPEAVIAQLQADHCVLALSSGSLGGVLPGFAAALDQRFA